MSTNPGKRTRASSRLRLFAMAALPVALLALGYAGYERLARAPEASFARHDAAARDGAGRGEAGRANARRNGSSSRRARRRGPWGPRYGRGGAGWSAPSRRAAPVVKAMTLRLEDYSPSFSFYGRIVASRQVDLQLPVTGRLVEVSAALREGEAFRRGELLARVDDFDYRTALEEARAALEETRAKMDETRAQIDQEQGAVENAREQLSLAESDLARMRKLAASGTASAKAHENARLTVAQRRLTLLQKQAALRMARARLKQLQAQFKARELALSRARRELADTRLVAPFDGRILSAAAAKGQYVTPSTKLATAIADGDLEVRFSISEDRYGDLVAAGGDVVGLPVRVIWKSGQARLEMTGRITRIAPRVDDESGAVIAFAGLDDAARGGALRIGSFVDVALAGAPLKGVARLPEGALHDGGVIYRVEDGRLVPLKVRPVLWEKGQVLVSGPLRAGMRVLASHLPNVKPGMRVKVAAQ